MERADCVRPMFSFRFVANVFWIKFLVATLFGFCECRLSWLIKIGQGAVPIEFCAFRYNLRGSTPRVSSQENVKIIFKLTFLSVVFD